MIVVAKIYITTPIYYINDLPHIGSFYTTLVADVLARWHRYRGNDVIFLTGLDENADKTVQAAKKKGYKDIQKYADDMAKEWLKTWKALGLSFDDFIRTTEERHKKKVLEFFAKANAKGDIYLGEYSGLYCEGCETFYTEKDLSNGLCQFHKTKPKVIQEKNYFFRLSKYGDKLLDYIKKDPSFIYPESRRNEVVSFIENGLKDISISRPGLEWGIEFPLDKNQKYWVWFDALINYLSHEDYWPATHLLAKDILRFHAIQWPAMLLSTGYKLPKQIVAHGFLTVEGQKMSKSLGNVVDPLKIAKKYGIDSLRFYLLKEISFGEDGDFSEKALVEKHNSELADSLGNLVNRVLVLAEKKCSGRIPEVSYKHLADTALLTVKSVEEHINNYQFHLAINEILKLIGEANKLINEKKPWELEKEEAHEILYCLLECLRFLSILLYPFIPETSEKIINQLNLEKDHIDFRRLEWGNLKPGAPIKRGGLLFKKIEAK